MVCRGGALSLGFHIPFQGLEKHLKDTDVPDIVLDSAGHPENKAPGPEVFGFLQETRKGSATQGTYPNRGGKGME